MVDDVLAAIEMVKGGIDTNQIFLLGHSFGGMLLPRINSKAKNVKSLIYFAASSRPLEDLYAMQAEYIIPQDTAINAEKIKMYWIPFVM
ncbi:MAG: alpha/beta hydrolase, partial [Bacteroidetes bacterium]|nr:alpha/beta hydrolase [Bacteroidota bacterium]